MMLPCRQGSGGGDTDPGGQRKEMEIHNSILQVYETLTHLYISFHLRSARALVRTFGEQVLNRHRVRYTNGQLPEFQANYSCSRVSFGNIYTFMCTKELRNIRVWS